MPCPFLSVPVPAELLEAGGRPQGPHRVGPVVVRCQLAEDKERPGLLASRGVPHGRSQPEQLPHREVLQAGQPNSLPAVGRLLKVDPWL